MEGQHITVMVQLIEPNESDGVREDNIIIVQEGKDKLSITCGLGVLLLDADEFHRVLGE
jgi:hypothetical protein